MIKTYDHLKGIQMNEKDTKPKLPIHIFLRARFYVKMKMQKCSRVGKMNNLITEKTNMGWVILSLDRESDLASTLYTRTLVSDFRSLWIQMYRD